MWFVDLVAPSTGCTCCCTGRHEPTRTSGRHGWSTSAVRRRNAYYIPSPGRTTLDPRGFEHQVKMHLKDHGAYKKRSTDTLTFNLGGQLPTVPEYSHLAISYAIKMRIPVAIRACASKLPRSQQSAIRDRLAFILDMQFRCVPLVHNDVGLTAELMDQFLSSHRAKESFRNTFNDIASFAVAARNLMSFRTEDRLLARFIGATLSRTVLENANDTTVDFCETASSERRISSESRGYVNRPRILREGPLAPQ